jgi:SmpA / OmlA family
MLFASPGMGPPGWVVIGVALFCLTVLGLSLLGIATGITLLMRPIADRQRLKGIAWLAAGVLLPLGCCVTPEVQFRLTHRTPPIGSTAGNAIRPGMNADEVRAILGEPHEVLGPSKTDTWHYHESSLAGHFFVSFDANGVVVKTDHD